MKINWVTMNDNWAFKHLCKHFINAMPNHDHEINGDKDSHVKYLCSPANFRKQKADSKTILHIDSNRWYKQ